MKTLFIILLSFTVSLSASAALKFDSDVPADIKAQALDDLTFMSQLQGTQQTPLHQQIFGAFGGASYQKFFDSRINSVGMDNCGLAMAVACVNPRQPHKMWLTKNFVQFSHPQIARLMTMYHESRHSETAHNNWPHDKCPVPFLDSEGKDMVSIWTGAKLEGQPGCDSTAFGSYGSSTILLANVAKYCTNCTDKVKMDAKLYSDDQLNRIDQADVKDSMIEDFKK